MIIIDAENAIIGRLGTVVAKKALLGEKINIINCDKAVISGIKKEILARFKRKRDLGVPLQGPYFHRKPEQIVKRTIRGMLPYKQEKGKKAFDSIKCYAGVPKEFEGKETTKLAGADVSKITKTKFVTIKEISRELGAKV